ncbi:MAG: flagellar FlbD family protein [Oscillospiraceae bacterium]|nr:flagellar FlbD family protein [Oscillospiraceae bacterium]
MVCVSRLNGKVFYINPDLIEFLEETPDTVLTTTTGKKLVVEDSVDEVISKIVAFKQKVFLGLPQVISQEDFEDIES